MSLRLDLEVLEQKRRGVLSLLALDAEFIGRMRTWTDSVEAFGRLIANSDMHAGNLSFFTSGTRVLDLTPTYDMLPALYAGQQDHLDDPVFALPALSPSHSYVWESVSQAALEFWQQVASDSRISTAFQKVARSNQSKVENWRKGATLLPH